MVGLPSNRVLAPNVRDGMSAVGEGGSRIPPSAVRNRSFAQRGRLASPGYAWRAGLAGGRKIRLDHHFARIPT